MNLHAKAWCASLFSVLCASGVVLSFVVIMRCLLACLPAGGGFSGFCCCGQTGSAEVGEPKEKVFE
jgi:hypothetical protein